MRLFQIDRRRSSYLSLPLKSVLPVLFQSDKKDIFATESTEKHGTINALIEIFPCPSVDSVDSVAIK
jgi:hypothetical protein